MRSLFFNNKLIISFIFKKDRIKIISFIVSMFLFLTLLVPIYDEILNSSTDIRIIVETMKNPAMVAMVGPVFVKDSYTLGSMYANYTLVFAAIIVGIWNIFFVSSNTRKDEEGGRNEILISLPIGRISSLFSTLLIALIANLLLAILTAIGFFKISKGELEINGIIIFVAAISSFGFLFACITAFFSQISKTTRTTNFLSLIFLMIAYFLRALGDVSSDILSWISPLGLITRTQNFVNDKTLPLLIITIEIVVFLTLSFIFAKNRDLNSGLIAERQGRYKLSFLVQGPTSFILNLLKTPLIIWSLLILSFSVMYASVFGDLESYIKSSDLIKAMLMADSNFSLMEQFIALLMVVMALISTIPLISIMNRVIKEEKSSLSEALLTKPLSRYRYLASFIIIAIVFSIILQVISAISFWYVGNQVTSELANLKTFIISSLIYLPAMWLSIGISTLLVGLLPNLAWLNYLYLGYGGFIIYLGRLLEFPKIMEKFTPFGHISAYPLEEINYTNLLILSLLSLALIIIGLYSYRRRDLIN